MRLLALGLCALLLSGCGSDDPADERSGGRAEQVEADFGAAADDVLPALVDELGGELRAMPAYFVECQVSGFWQYTARGELHQPSGNARQVADRTREVLTAAGFDATVGDGLDVQGTRDGITVVVSRALDTDVESVSFLRISMNNDCEDYSDTDEAYADDAEQEDYAQRVG